MAKGVSSSFVETPKTIYACSKGDREKSYFSLFLFFFFFLRNRTLRSYKINSEAKRNYKESLVTRGAISSGMELYQTCSSLPDLELLAKQ